ncbi:hypothetical protein [Streptomyces sp. NPDC008150]|uniref:hypothetical protein n=1 Tax=Streptomyces sp. NPDC008150 TaxID=3364816 RepID=UPI0036E7BCF2
MSQYQPQPPQPFGPPVPPPAPTGGHPKWARKRIVLPIGALLFFVGIGIGTSGNSSDDGKNTSAKPAATITVTATPKAKTDQAAAEPAPTVTVTKTKTVKPKATKAAEEAEAPAGKAVFKVWGSAPAGVDITYGSDGTNLQGSGLPMEKTLSVKDDAMYYQVTAQLQGGGTVHCSVTIDGKTKSGQASGGYNICSAQLNSDFSGGFS